MLEIAHKAFYIAAMSNHKITILCIVIPVLCVVTSIVLFFFEQAAQEKEMFDREKKP